MLPTPRREDLSSEAWALGCMLPWGMHCSLPTSRDLTRRGGRRAVDILDEEAEMSEVRKSEHRRKLLQIWISHSGQAIGSSSGAGTIQKGHDGWRGGPPSGCHFPQVKVWLAWTPTSFGKGRTVRVYLAPWVYARWQRHIRAVKSVSCFPSGGYSRLRERVRVPSKLPQVVSVNAPTIRVVQM